MTGLRHAPDFPDHLPWLRAAGPLTLHGDLAAHVVIVWFYSSSSPYTEAVAATLGWLERRFAGRMLAVVGVHAPRYPIERTADHARATARRLGLDHPVLHDQDLLAWQAFGCRAWPTLVLVDAGGQLRYQGAGVPDRARLEGAVAELLAEAESEASYLVEPFAHWPEGEPARGLCAPSGVVVAGDLVWVSDTGNHRLVAFDRASERVRHVLGTGAPGSADGSEPGFCAPRGLATDGERLFVADSGNGAVRAVDLATRSASTVLGGGEAALAAPVALAWHDGRLLVALAAGHEVLSADVAARRAERLLECRHPAGLAAGPRVAVASADDDAVLLVGGEPLGARFRHPRGVCWHGGELWVADTFGGAVRRFDPDGAEREPAALGLRTPAAIAVADGVAFVADSDRGAVLRLDGAGGVQPFGRVADLPAPPAAERAHAEVELRALAPVALRLPVPVPTGERALDAPVEVFARDGDGSVVLTPVRVGVPRDGEVAVFDSLTTLDEGAGTLELVWRWASARASGGAPHLHERRVRLPVRLSAAGPTAAEIAVD